MTKDDISLGHISDTKLRDYGSPKDNPFLDDRGYAPLELDLVDLAYRHTCGDRDMAYLIGEEIYEYLKKIEPKINDWYKEKV